MSGGPDALAVAPAAGAGTRRVAAGSRILELDALRGFAALGILCLHTMQKYFFWAWSCVDFFFILSGFLITSILLANADTPRMLFSFYARRALRIWPVYYVTFVAAVAIFLVAGRLGQGVWPSLPSGEWLDLVFLQETNHYIPGGPALEYIWYFQHSWSLAVEEQFYLLWPLLFFFVRPPLRLLAPVCLVVIAATIWARGHGAYFYLLITRIDGLMFGIVLAYLAADRGSVLYRARAGAFVWPALAGLLLLLPYLLSHGERNLWADAPARAVEVAAFCTIYVCVVAAAIRWSGAPFLALLRLPVLTHIGKLSFAIYMFQVPIAYLLFEAVARKLMPPLLGAVLIWVLTLMAAHMSYIFIERHALRLKSRFPYRGASAPAG